MISAAPAHALIGLLSIRIMEKPWLGLFDKLEDAVGNLVEQRQQQELTTATLVQPPACQGSYQDATAVEGTFQ